MRKFARRLLATDSGAAALVSRIVLGSVVFAHGLQKSLGLFGGYGFSGTMNFFTQTQGLPWIVAFLVIAGESLGALSLIVGFMTRFSAGSITLIMLGAIFMVHWRNGFFMNWFGTQPGEGFEYHLLAIGLALSLVISGGGKYSVDRALSHG